jgi:flagellar biogenesis protein FliO
MTTSASEWPKLSHPRSRWALRLLLLSAGVLVAVGRADAQTQAPAQTREPYPASESGNSRVAVRRPALPESQETVATPAEPTHTAHHKTWKEAARAHNEDKSRETSSPSLSPWTAVGALAVVVSLILILARIFRRHAPLFSQTLPTEALEVLGRRFLDQKQSIVLLRIGSRILVVGSSAAGLQGIGELSDPIEVDLVAGICRGTKTGQGIGTSFLSLLRGQASPQKEARPRNQSPRRADPRTADAPLADEDRSARMADPQHELMRRLRAASTAGAPHPESGEVYRG